MSEVTASLPDTSSSPRHLTTLLQNDLLLLVIILLLGAALRFIALGYWSFWTDELYTWRLVVPELKILTLGVPDDQHPPLYYLLFHAMLQIRDNDVWLRLPSALAGWLAIIGMWRIGVIGRRPRWGLLAAALLALSPLHIWYSREARMYGLASLFWVLSLYYFIASFERDSWIDMFGLAAATLLGLFTAYPTLGLWGLQLSLFWLCWHLAGRKIGRLLRWLLAQGLITAVFALWWPLMQEQLQRGLTFNWPILPQFGIDLSGTLADTLSLALAAGGLVVLGGILLWLIVWWQPRLLQWAQKLLPIIAIAIILAFILATVAGAIPRGLSIRRQLFVFWPVAILLATWAFASIHKPQLVSVILGVSLVLAAITAWGRPFEDWRGIAQYIEANGQPGDVVVLTPGWARMAFDRYYANGRFPYQGANKNAYTDDAPAPFAAGQRVWLVWINTETTDAQTTPITHWFASHADNLTRRDFRHLTVIEYAVR
ncbi:MAG: glycosyltransferase family 39 protein [Chloroflexota bacterium]